MSKKANGRRKQDGTAETLEVVGTSANIKEKPPSGRNRRRRRARNRRKLKKRKSQEAKKARQELERQSTRVASAATPTTPSCGQSEENLDLDSMPAIEAPPSRGRAKGPEENLDAVSTPSSSRSPSPDKCVYKKRMVRRSYTTPLGASKVSKLDRPKLYNTQKRALPTLDCNRQGIPLETLELLARLDCVIIGGCPRDVFLGKFNYLISDIDVVSKKTMEEISEFLEAERGHVRTVNSVDNALHPIFMIVTKGGVNVDISPCPQELRERRSDLSKSEFAQLCAVKANAWHNAACLDPVSGQTAEAECAWLVAPEAFRALRDGELRLISAVAYFDDPLLILRDLLAFTKYDFPLAFNTQNEGMWELMQGRKADLMGGIKGYNYAGPLHKLFLTGRGHSAFVMLNEGERDTISEFLAAILPTTALNPGVFEYNEADIALIEKTLRELDSDYLTPPLERTYTDKGRQYFFWNALLRAPLFRMLRSEAFETLDAAAVKRAIFEQLRPFAKHMAEGGDDPVPAALVEKLVHYFVAEQAESEQQSVRRASWSPRVMPRARTESFSDASESAAGEFRL